MDIDLTQLSNQIRRERANDIDEDVEIHATQRIQEFRTRKRMLMRDQAFRQWTIDYIRDERDAAQDDDREDPLCSCGALCAVKRGEIPPAIKLEDNFADGLARLKQQHEGGAPIVVQEAADAFADYYATTLQIGEEALVSLIRNDVITLDEPVVDAEDAVTAAHDADAEDVDVDGEEVPADD